MLDKLLKYSNNNSLYINKIIPNAKPCIGLYTNEIKAMRMGKKLQFITENGDLYEAELKFIRNLKK